MKSLAELKAMRDAALKDITLRTGQETTRILIGMGTCGIASGAREILATLLAEIEVRGLKNITVQPTGCMGTCCLEPMMEVQRPNQPTVTYAVLDSEKVKRIVVEDLVNQQTVTEYLIGNYIE